MGKDSGIEWTDHTFNPWMGCTKVSEGCKFCYAEGLMDKRWGKVVWGPQGARVRTKVGNWRQPLVWDREAEREGVRARVFCGSLCDVLEDRPELVGWRGELWELIARTPALDWLLLTKRPENAFEMLPDYWWSIRWPENVWLGTSVENQEQADRRIPALLRVPAGGRFLSVEPMLGAVDLGNFLNHGTHGGHGRGIDWVICGGESGPNARPMHPDWARGVRDQCMGGFSDGSRLRVPFFFKQWGEWAPFTDNGPLPGHCRYVALDGLVRSGDFDADTDACMGRVGKKAAGRVLDGRTWDEMPGRIGHGDTESTEGAGEGNGIPRSAGLRETSADRTDIGATSHEPLITNHEVR